MTATAAVVHHLRRPFLGHVATLRDAGVALLEVDRRRGDALPDLDAIDAVVTLGGEDSVRDVDALEYLAEEARWLAEAVRRRLPVLGICLGGQLLAHALGGEVRRMPRRTVAWRLVAVTDREDELVRELAAPLPVLHWNEDAFTLPPGAVEVLEAHSGGVEAFRWGDCAWGVQFHPDVTADALEGWYELPEWLEQAGVEPAQARAADARHLPAHDEAARALFGAFAKVVHERRRAGAAPLAH